MSTPPNQDHRRKSYTDEVEAALRALGKIPDPPPMPVVPAGQVQYLVAVGETVNEGCASPAIVAAILRAEADQLLNPTIQGET